MFPKGRSEFLAVNKKPLKEIICPLGITVSDFIKCCDKFTNKNLFKKDDNLNLLKDKYGNLIKVAYDNK